MPPRRLASMASLAALGVALGCSNAGAITPPFDSGGSNADAVTLNKAWVAAHHGRYTEAIAIVSGVIANKPDFAGAYWDRGSYYVDAGRYDEAAADYDRVIAMHPDNFAIVLDKAVVTLRRGDLTTAYAQIQTVVHMPPNSYFRGSFGRGYTIGPSGHAPSFIYGLASIAEQLLHKDDASIYDMRLMLQTENQFPAHVLSWYCWQAGIVGLLESAEMTCQQSIEDNPHDIGQYDSLGFVHLRMKQWDKAIADYNTALDNRPDLTTSLYGRGIAKKARGDIAGSNADIAAATRDEPDIANIMQRLGLGSQ